MSGSDVTETAALTGKQRKYLRGLAHTLKPVAHVGAGGITEGVVAAIGEALATHELIKVRLLSPQDKSAMAEEVADRSGAHLCGLVGHTLILYKRHPEHPRIELP